MKCVPGLGRGFGRGEFFIIIETGLVEENKKREKAGHW